MPKQDGDAVNEPVVADTTPTESAPVETNESEVTGDPLGDDAFDDIDEEVAKEATEGDDESDEETPQPVETEETEPETQSRGDEKPLSPKAENRFQKLANENRELKEQLERLQLQENQLATEQDLINQINPETGDYYTPQEVERIAWQQAREAQAQQVAQQRYELEVQQNQETIYQEAERVAKEFPIFNPESPEFNQGLRDQAAELLMQSLIVDNNGILVGSKISPYKLYKTIADSTKANAPVYQAKAQRSTERMLANADVASGAAQTKTKDADLDDFDNAWED